MENQSVEDVLGPVPAGMDWSENRAHKDNAVVITLCVVTVVMVILRFVVRTRGQIPRPELDDWLIAVAVVSCKIPKALPSRKDLLTTLKIDPAIGTSCCVNTSWELGYGEAHLGNNIAKGCGDEEGKTMNHFAMRYSRLTSSARFYLPGYSSTSSNSSSSKSRS
jgi:hypothetical protein